MTVQGRALAIECKSATGRQSEAQAVWQRIWQAAGGVYVLARDVQTAGRAIAELGDDRVKARVAERLAVL